MTTYWFVAYSLGDNVRGTTGVGNMCSAIEGRHIHLRELARSLAKDHPNYQPVIINFQQISRETFEEFQRG